MAKVFLYDIYSAPARTGDMLFFNNQNPQVLVNGNAGEVLQSNGYGNAPSWVASSPSYITSVSDTSTVDLDVTAGNLTANVILTNTYIGFGNASNNLSSNSNFYYNPTINQCNIGFGNGGLYIDSNVQYFTLGNSGQLSLLTVDAGNGDITNSISDAFIINNLTNGRNYLTVDLSNNTYNFGDLSNGINSSKIIIDDTLKTISLLSDNGVIVSSLSGGATEMVVADSTGLLSKQLYTVGTVTSVGLTTSSPAFTITNSPITTSGNLTIDGAGTSSQYIKGDGTLGNFPDIGSSGGVVYYFNGGTSSSIGGDYQMSRIATVGSPANFTKTGDGVIVTFATDAGDPDTLVIPGGLWIFRSYCSMSSNGGSPELSAIVKVYDGATYTTVATGSPEVINGGTSIDLYTYGVSVPTTTIATTDRIVVEFVLSNSGGKTITFYTQDGRLNCVDTTFSSGIVALSGLTASTQYLATGTSGTDFNISSSTATHTFNLPTASSINRGLLSTSDWTTFNNKVTSLSAGTGITIGGTTTVPIITNSAPDQTVSLSTTGTGLSVTGSYPSFTLQNTLPDQTVVLSNGTGISITGSYPNFTITNTAPSTTGWSLTGNTGTTAGTNFIGTTDSIDLVFKTNNSENARISSAGVVQLGDSTTNLKITKVSSGVYPTTSYSNLGGSGDRTGLITTTAHCGVSGGCSIASPANRMVNGDYSSTNWYLTSSPLADISTAYIIFDFGSQKLINEAKSYVSATATTCGTWQWKGSNDNITYTNIGSTFNNIQSATTLTHTTLNGNTTPYRYYQIYCVSGSQSGGGYWLQFDFKISSAISNSSLLQSNITDGVTAGGNIILQNTAGNVGIVEGSPASSLAVLGNLAIGSTAAYSEVSAPSGGAVIQGNVGIGVTSPSAKLHAISTTEQFRIGYDTSNYINFTTGSTGITTIGGAGSAVKTIFTNTVGINGITPTSSLHTNSLATSIVTKTANYTLTSSDYTVIFDGTSLTATLPAASTCSGRTYVIVNRNATALTTSVAYQTLITGATSTTIASATALWIQSNGTNYYQIK